MAATTILSGARIIAAFGNNIFVWGTNVTFGEEYQYEGAETLDHLEVKEWVPVAIRVSLSAGLFRTVGNRTGEGSVKEQGLMPKNEGSPNKVLLADAFDCVLLDRVTNKRIIAIQGVKLASYNIAVTPKGLLGTDVNFVAIRATDA